MKLGPIHLRKDGCWREVAQDWQTNEYGQRVGGKPRTIVLRLLFEWPWQKKDPLLQAKPVDPAAEFRASQQTYDDCLRYGNQTRQVTWEQARNVPPPDNP